MWWRNKMFSTSSGVKQCFESYRLNFWACIYVCICDYNIHMLYISDVPSRRFIHCVQKKETKVFSVISSIKLGRFWCNFVHSLAFEWINWPQNYVNLFHFTWIVSLHYLAKLEMLIATCHWVVRERNARINPTSAIASKFARFESCSWLQLWRILQEM